MKHGEFIINGISSEEINSIIQFRPEILTPKRKVRRESIPGVSEDYLFDEEAYENTPINLELVVQGKSEKEMNRIKDKITFAFIGGRYIDFEPYWDRERVYQVEVVEPPTFVPNGNHPLIIPYTVGLSSKPFKTERKTLNIELESKPNSILINPSYYESEPVITLYGTGNMEVIVNDQEYIFKDVDDYVIIDSRIESAYKMVAGIPVSRNNRMYTMDFPILNPGDNHLAIAGNATKAKVEVRWKTLVS